MIFLIIVIVTGVRWYYILTLIYPDDLMLSIFSCTSHSPHVSSLVKYSDPFSNFCWFTSMESGILISLTDIELISLHKKCGFMTSTAGHLLFVHFTLVICSLMLNYMVLLFWTLKSSITNSVKFLYCLQIFLSTSRLCFLFVDSFIVSFKAFLINISTCLFTFVLALPTDTILKSCGWCHIMQCLCFLRTFLKVLSSYYPHLPAHKIGAFTILKN